MQRDHPAFADRRSIVGEQTDRGHLPGDPKHSQQHGRRGNSFQSARAPRFTPQPGRVRRQRIETTPHPFHRAPRCFMRPVGGKPARERAPIFGRRVVIAQKDEPLDSLLVHRLHIMLVHAASGGATISRSMIDHDTRSLPWRFDLA